MNITSRAIHYTSRLDLAIQIAKTAPRDYTGFTIHPDMSKGFCTVTYAHRIDAEYLSIGKLVRELGMELDKNYSPSEPINAHYDTWKELRYKPRSYGGYVIH